MIIKAGASVGLEFSGPLPVRRFAFRVGEGRPELLLDGPRPALLVKAASSYSVLESDGIRILVQGPVGGRPGKQLTIEVRQSPAGLLLEVRPRGTDVAAAVKSAPPIAVPPSTPPAPSQTAAGTGTPVVTEFAAQSEPAAPSAATAVLISETVQGDSRTTLWGISSPDALPVRTGELLPVEVHLARPDRTVFSLRGIEVQAPAGGFLNGQTYWAEVVAGAPHAVIRIQNRVTDEALPAAPAVPASPQAGLPQLLSPQDIPVGTNFTARVLARLPGGEFLLDLGGRQLAAALPEGIETGDELLLRVDGDGQGAQLRVLERLHDLRPDAAQTPSIAGRPQTRPALSDSLGLLSRLLRQLPPRDAQPEALHRLAAKLEQVIGRDAPPETGRIQTLVEESGLQYEAKLARLLVGNRLQDLAPVLDNDLKALLLRAQNQIRAQGGPLGQYERLADGIERHLTRIESLQTANVLAQNQSAPMLLELPFLVGGQLSSVELQIQPDGRRAGGEKRSSGENFKLLFLLDLDGLGRTRVDAELSRESLRGVVSVEESRALGSLQSLLPGLQKRLEQAGFRHTQLDVRASAKRRPAETVEAEASDATGNTPAGDLNLIDVVA